MGDRVIPAALEESQTSWSHGFLVFLVEIKGVEGPVGQLVAVRKQVASEWEGAQEGAQQAILGSPWSPPRRRTAAKHKTYTKRGTSKSHHPRELA